MTIEPISIAFLAVVDLTVPRYLFFADLYASAPIIMMAPTNGSALDLFGVVMLERAARNTR